MRLMRASELGQVPDGIIRMGIRRLLRQRLRDSAHLNCESEQLARESFLRAMRAQAIALNTQEANEQHYELPAEFFELVLGRHLKYSSCEWAAGCTGLDDAEAAMLARTAERAQLTDGQRVLELGCGWGSFSLWAAERFPASSFVAVSNSHSQRAFIERTAKSRNLGNIRVITGDMNEFEPDGTFDRVVSVEMFEHMRNWEMLLDRIAGWLAPQGRVLVHVFCHRQHAYLFETEGADNWMGRYFFTGGLMPSDDLIYRMQGRLRVDTHWRHSGRHYQATAEAWLQNLDAHRDQAMPILRRAYGDDQAAAWLGRWRIFFMSCAELFGFGGGDEWWVSHYLLRPNVASDDTR